MKSKILLDKQIFHQLEARAGGAVRAAQLLGVCYRSSYAAWKSGRIKTPPYILASIHAHLQLSNVAFKKRLSDSQK